MKDLFKIIALFYSVWFLPIKAQGCEKYPCTDPDTGNWIWGPADDIETIDSRFNGGKVDDKSEACKPYDPDMPDFKKVGDRISKVACNEYIWKDQVIAEKLKRGQTCETQRQKFNFSITTGEDFNYYFIGGRSSFPNEYPHMGAIGWEGATEKWKFKCGGTLLTSKFVLTAAHCSKSTEDDNEIISLEPKMVRFGHVNIANNSIIYNNDVEILRIITHPSYKSPLRDHDIAILELKTPVTFTESIKPACLWSESKINIFGNIGTVTGWGVLKPGSKSTSPILQTGELDIISNDECNSLLQNLRNRNWAGITSSQMCAGQLSGGKDACLGDSGGPLQVKVTVKSNPIFYIIGVTSFGFGCAHKNTPGIYTRVSSYLDWIESVVWQQS